MKKTRAAKQPAKPKEDPLPGYRFDYRKTKPNRCVSRAVQGSRAVILDPDVAAVFSTPESVNSVLRALIETMPHGNARTRMIKTPELTIGKAYTWAEACGNGVVHSDDYEDACKAQYFNENFVNHFRQGEEILFEYIEIPLEQLRTRLEGYRKSYQKSVQHWRQVEDVKAKLQNREPAFCFFLIKRNTKLGVVAGNHRAIAFLELSMPRLPVLLLRYADWTEAFRITDFP